MKVACRKSTCVRASAGSEGDSSRSAASICCVSLTVSTPGCFCTIRMTAGLPSIPASPRLGATPSVTSATALSGMVTPPGNAPTGVAASSVGSVVRPTFRTTSSRPACVANPPVVLLVEFPTARTTSSRVRFTAASACGFGSTTYCLRPPPIAITLETPGMVSSLRPITCSATESRVRAVVK